MSPALPVTPALPPPAPSLAARIHDWRLRRMNVEFAVLGMMATVLAFYAAILLNLHTPATAAVTVWVVANTKPGHVLSKSVYRVLGTLIGAAAGVAMVATLDSTPVLLFAALACWVALCTGIGNLLRHFRSYFGLLAGYSAAFIVMGAYFQPDQVLEVALDRTSAIVIGVLSTSLVVSVLGIKQSAADMERSLRQVQGQCLQAIRQRWDLTAEQLTQARLELNRGYVNTEALLEYANLESPGFHQQVRELRALTGILLDAVDASRLAAHQTLPSQQKEIRAVFLEISEALAPAIEGLNAENMAHSRRALERLQRLVVASARNAPSVEEREVLYAIAHQLRTWARGLTPDELRKTNLRNPLRPDLHGAGRHALRAFLGLLSAIAFWNLTGWQEGPNFVMNAAAFCALSSTASHPAKILVMFSKAMAVAAIVGFVFKFCLLPFADGFATMMLCFAVVVLPIACLAFSRHSQLDIIGVTIGIFVLALTLPTNHMSYHPAAYVSGAIGAVAAALFLAVIFSWILPTRPEMEAGKVLAALNRSVRSLIDWPALTSSHRWRQTAHRQLRALQLKAKVTPPELNEGLDLLDYGSCLLRLRELAGNVTAELQPQIHDVLIFGRRGWQSPVIVDAAAVRALSDLEKDLTLDPQLRFTVTTQLKELRRLLPI